MKSLYSSNLYTNQRIRSGYGNFYSNKQIVESNNIIKLENSNNNFNIELINNKIKVLVNGTYNITFNSHCEIDGFIGLFMNHNKEPIMTVKSLGNISFNKIINLPYDSLISFYNLSKDSLLVLSPVNITIHKIDNF